MLEQYSHDKEGRLVAVTVNNVTALRYEYPDTRATAPNSVTTARGAVLRLHYDEDGGLARAVLGSNEHAWSTQPGRHHLELSPPWSGWERVSYVSYVYTVARKQTEVELGWAEGAATVSQGEPELRDKRKHHANLLKEQKLRISGMARLSNTNLPYQQKR